MLHGSLARGEARYDSDIDLLVDFSSGFEAEAWRLAEEACASMKSDSDIKPLAWRAETFRDEVLPTGKIIS